MITETILFTKYSELSVWRLSKTAVNLGSYVSRLFNVGRAQEWRIENIVIKHLYFPFFFNELNVLLLSLLHFLKFYLSPNTDSNVYSAISTGWLIHLSFLRSLRVALELGSGCSNQNTTFIRAVSKKEKQTQHFKQKYVMIIIISTLEASHVFCKHSFKGCLAMFGKLMN